MSAQMKKQLDALMGTNRNTASNSNNKKETTKRMTDNDVCKYYLVGLCPYDVLTNTKLDIGICRKHHSDPLKADYAQLKTKEFGFEYELMRFLESFISDVDRNVERAKKKLDSTTTEITGMESPQDKTTQEIIQLQQRAEELGENGQVDEAKFYLQKAESLKQQKLSLLNPDQLNVAPKMKACDVCAAYLSVYETDKRLIDHNQGKLHLGVLEIRNKLKELKDLNPKPARSNYNSSSSSSSSSRDDRRRYDDRDRDRERDRDRKDDRDRR